LYYFFFLFLPKNTDVNFLAPKAISAGFAIFHAAEPMSGKFDKIICVTVLLSHGLRTFVINGVTEVEEEVDMLSIVSENLDLIDEVTPFVSIDPQLSFRY
jgi:hypothetical protein